MINLVPSESDGDESLSLVFENVFVLEWSIDTTQPHTVNSFNPLITHLPKIDALKLQLNFSQLFSSLKRLCKFST
jgi:hypothetical protein